MGWVLLAGVRPDAPLRSDTFLLLLVAVRLTRCSRDGSYVVRQARAPTIRAPFSRLQRQSSYTQSRSPCAKAGATTRHTTAQSIAPARGWARRRSRRETERRRTTKRRAELTLRDSNCSSDQNRSCEDHLGFETGEEG